MKAVYLILMWVSLKILGTRYSIYHQVPQKNMYIVYHVLSWFIISFLMKIAIDWGYQYPFMDARTLAHQHHLHHREQLSRQHTRGRDRIPGAHGTRADMVPGFIMESLLL